MYYLLLLIGITPIAAVVARRIENVLTTLVIGWIFSLKIIIFT